jgi:NAD+ kinase
MAKKIKLAIFGDPKKGDVATAIREFISFVRDRAQIVVNCCVDKCSFKMVKNCDFAIVFGGDGTIINAARILCGSDLPIIGVNLGKLGFLAEFNIEELKKYFDQIAAGKLNLEKRMVLDCKVVRVGKTIFQSLAVNDVFITAGPPFRMIELKLYVDKQSLAGCISDGLIVATPTGSTAYNLSSGGPILSGKMEGVVITPISPHSLSFRPIVINADSKIEVEGVKLNKGTTLSIDGQVSIKFTINDRIKVEKSKGGFLLVNNPERTSWDTLATKLGWAEKPKYNTGRI